MTRMLISFDIDGTMEFGDPPGGVTVDMVRKAKELGFVVGSCSDRSLGAQQALWDRNNLVVDFVSLKHLLSEIMVKFEAEKYCHIGDRDLDQQFATLAGFDFIWNYDATTEPWLTWGDTSGSLSEYGVAIANGVTGKSR
ncbi:MAG: HAD family hydrolase [Dehalococcoidia bacterium]|nr:HAD family hydrolase [Dehalococcoidia bacterium]